VFNLSHSMFDLHVVQKPAKILYVIGSLDVGGTERHLSYILPKLLDRNFNPVVFVLTNRGGLADFLESKGVRVIAPFFSTSLNKFPKFLKRPLLLVSAIFSYIAFVLRWNPKIIHFFLPLSYLIGGLCSLFLGDRILIMSRRSLNYYQKRYPAISFIERLLHQRMNAVLANSIAVLNNLVDEGIPDARCGLIYNGIEVSKLNHCASRIATRENIGISPTAFLMICVANLIPYKGHHDLIVALSLARNKLPKDWAVAFIGRDTGIANDLKLLSVTYGIENNILWLGERADVMDLCAAGDLGLLCSHEEGFSNSVIECMAAGLPMIVTDVGGNAEAVVDGECGIVVQPRSPLSISTALIALSTNAALRETMAFASRCRATNFFSLDRCVDKYHGLYTYILFSPRLDVQKMIDQDICE